MILQMQRRFTPEGLCIVELEGSIHTGPDCRRVEHEVEGLIREKHLRVIFEMSKLTHVDSAAVGTIVRCFGQLKKAGGGLRLAGPKGMVEGVLKLTRLDKILLIYPDVEAASRDFPAAQDPNDTATG